jgi:hypothetical protein
MECKKGRSMREGLSPLERFIFRRNLLAQSEGFSVTTALVTILPPPNALFHEIWAICVTTMVTKAHPKPMVLMPMSGA